MERSKETSVRKSTVPAIPQKKELTVNRPGDPYEQEAEQVSEQVMQMPDAARVGGSPKQGLVNPLVQTRSSGAAGTEAVNAPAIVQETLNKPGEALDSGASSYLEPRFGHNFSHVRVHHDGQAAESARSVNALAYTVGHHISFGEGQYAPSSPGGRKLIAHELTHVLQQTPGTLRRFGSAEHKSLGEEASKGTISDINIGTDQAPDFLSFGEVVALSGDYFGSIEALRTMASTQGGRQKIRWVRWWAIDQYSNPKVAEPSLPEDQKKELKDQYYTLAGGNISHFSAGGTAKSTYKDSHTAALRSAFIAGVNAANSPKKQSVVPDLTFAKTNEAFAQHFLSDMFSGGHVRTERQSIKTWYKTNMPDADAKLIQYMAHIMHRWAASEHNVADFFGQVPSENDLVGTIKQIGGKALAAFGLGDIVSLAYHNADSEGLEVVSDADSSGKVISGGFKWLDLGDGKLATSATTRGMALAAMKDSLAEVDDMATRGMNSKTPPASGALMQDIEPVFQNELSRMGPFNALKYIPRVDTASTKNNPMVWEWGKMNQWMYAAMDVAAKGDLADNVKSVANEQKNPDHKGALMEFCYVLQAIGVRALEQAIGTHSRDGKTLGPNE